MFNQKLIRVILAIAILLTGCNGGGGSSSGSSSTPTTTTLQSIVLSPINPSIGIGNSSQFIATGHYSSGSESNLTNTVTWTSSATNIATINTTGNALGVAIGSTTISASLNGVTGTTLLTVESAFAPLSGWPNYLAMGGISGGDVAEPTVKVNSVFTYNGASGGGDRGMVENPYKIFDMINVAKSIKDNNNMSEVNPAIVEYQWDLSGGWNTDDVLIEDNLALHFFNLMMLANLFQNDAFKDTGTYGTILLNPDALGFIGNTSRQDVVEALDIPVQNALNRAECMMTKTTNFNSYSQCVYGGTSIPIVESGNANDLLSYLRAHIDNWTAGDAFVKCMQASLFEECKNAGAAPNVPTFENNFNSWIQAQNWIIENYGPNVMYGWHENISAIPVGGAWVHESTPPVSAYVSAVLSDLEKFKVFDGTYRPNFLYLDRFGADDFSSDSGHQELTSSQLIFYNDQNWEAVVTAAKQLSEGIGQTRGASHIPVMLWQIPAAHIPVQGESAPEPLEEGSAPDYFFGDSNLNSDLSNVATWVNSTITPYLTGAGYGTCAGLTPTECLSINNFDWTHENKTQLQQATDSHVFAILWGAGGYATSIWPSSTCPYIDHGWMASKISNYYNSTQPLTAH